MTDWMIQPTDGDRTRTTDAWRSLPIPPVETWSDPRHYLAGPDLIAAVNTALLLGQPLLVTGEPGCGKTELANFLAWKLGLERDTGANASEGSGCEYALRYDMKSDSRARDLFYSVDLVERFHAAHVARDAAAVDPLRFIRFHALGRALLYARPPDDLSARLESWQAHPGETRRSIVLIDEIDKAPRDVPNDLLTEIEGMRIFLPELNREIRAPTDRRPVVIITSNGEKPLSDAFLRRCVYYHIELPTRSQLDAILERRLGLRASEPLVSTAVDSFLEVRDQPLQKRPGTSEMLAFLHALIGFGFSLGEPLSGRSDWHRIAAATLLKTRDDQLRAFPGLAAAA